ncbi:hypothetical protein ACN38_g3755, partial [Penicillium nordicum]
MLYTPNVPMKTKRRPNTSEKEPNFHIQPLDLIVLDFLLCNLTFTTLCSINLTLHNALRRPPRRPLLTGYEP